jgi:glutathione S-transferase
MLTLNVLKPSVNNMCVRVFLRAAGLEFTENDVYGHTRDADYLAKCPAHMTPLLEDSGLPAGVLWESCAIMQYLAGKHGLTKFYPTDATARAQIDAAMFYITGTLYPLVARATYPALGFPAYPGEVAASDADAGAKAAAQKAALDAVAEPLAVFKDFYLNGRDFIGGSSPSIADMRLAATLEFLAAVDYALPDWAQAYIGRIEAALGDAYAEPAGDVRGYIQYVKSQAAG